MPPPREYNILSIHSHKGGVGKSTLAAVLGIALARDGRKVCLVDLDLLAPGLHRVLQARPTCRPVLDYLVSDPAHPGSHAKAAEVCAPPKMEFTDAPEILLVHGEVDVPRARALQAYLLTDYRTGLVQARLERLLDEIHQIHRANTFVLDTPPSLYGVSGAARDLLGPERALAVYVCTPTRPDLLGTQELLTHLAPTHGGDVAEAFVLNLFEPAGPLDNADPDGVRRAVLAEMARLTPPPGSAAGDPSAAASFAPMLAGMRVGFLPRLGPLAFLSAPDPGKPALSVSDILARDAVALAGSLVAALDATAPGGAAP